MFHGQLNISGELKVAMNADKSIRHFPQNYFIGIFDTTNFAPSAVK
jgi:hypothetical protein